MDNTKAWWESKTIWVNAIATLFAVLAMFHVGIPADVTQEQVVTAIMAVVSIVNVVLRLFTKHAIA